MLREIEDRTSDGVRVTLYWDTEKDSLVVETEDHRNPENDLTLIGIPKADGMMAFTHPYSYQTVEVQ